MNNLQDCRARGFSLIEVLVSIVILAFGVISMGGLQLASLRSAQASTNFSIAATLSRDYSEMMRSNFPVSNKTGTWVAGAYQNPYMFDTSNTATFTASPGCILAPCTANEIALMHVADWAQRVANPVTLPGGRAVVCRDSTPRNADGTYKWACDNIGTAVSIKLGWLDKRDKEERGTTTVALTPANPQLVMGGITGYTE